jgi:hypothetical protein
MLQAIETIYKDYRFRSRLEARWAVFFDAMGIKWEYEIEGFLLDDGTKYLPDFWLPETQSWLEVKPDEFTLDESHKCTLLSKNHCVIMVSGLPKPKSYDCISHIPADCNNGVDGIFSLPIFLFYHDDEIGVWENTGRVGEIIEWEPLVSACLKAKQARFEYGESG